MQNTKHYKQLALIGMIIGLACLIFLQYFDWDNILQEDLIQYWAAAKIFLAGQNPYDSAALFKMEQSSAFGASHLSEPIIFYNPPMALTLTFWLGYLSFEQAKQVWFILAFIVLTVSVLSWFRIVKGLGRSRSFIYLAAALICTFPPIHHILYFGQISFFILMGFTLWWYFYFVRDQQFLSGIFLSICLIKPHLLYLLFILLALDFLRGRNFPVVIGVCCGTALLAFLPLIINSQIHHLYFNFSTSPPIFWKTPTLGTFVQGWSNNHTVLTRAWPSIITATAVCFYYLSAARHFLDQKLMLALLPLSLCTAMYGWVFDQILLFPTVLYCLAIIVGLLERNARGSLICLLLLFSENIVTAFMPRDTGQHTYVWYPLLLFMLILYLLKKEDDRLALAAVAEL